MAPWALKVRATWEALEVPEQRTPSSPRQKESLHRTPAKKLHFPTTFRNEFCFTLVLNGTNELEIFGPFNFFEQEKEVRFKQTHNQGVCQLFLTVSWSHRAKGEKPNSVLDSLQFRKQHTRQVRGP